MPEDPLRPSRFNLNVPLSFASDDLTVEGECENVSASGLLAEFKQHLDIWTVGELSMLVGDYYVSIKARVAREHGFKYGLAFLIRSDNDRLAVDIMVDFASSRTLPGEALRYDI